MFSAAESTSASSLLGLHAVDPVAQQGSEIDAARAIPNPFSWDRARADVRELMIGGLGFWEAVDGAGKSQALHHRFGLKALVYMLESIIYWEALDSTPWMR